MKRPPPLRSPGDFTTGSAPATPASGAPTPAAGSVPSCEGWVRKKGAGILHGYKERWFELHGRYVYYSRAKGARPIGVLNVAGATLKSESGGGSASPPPPLPAVYLDTEGGGCGGGTRTPPPRSLQGSFFSSKPKRNSFSFATPSGSGSPSPSGGCEPSSGPCALTLEGPYLSRRYQLTVENARERTRWFDHLGNVGVVCFDSSEGCCGQLNVLFEALTPPPTPEKGRHLHSSGGGGERDAMSRASSSSELTGDCGGAAAASADPTSLSDDTLEFVRRLGSGSFGSVDLHIHRPTGRRYAVKSIRMRDGSQGEEGVRQELSVLPRLRHPFIVSLHHAFVREESSLGGGGRVMCLVLTYLGGGELSGHIRREGRFDDAKARFYAAEIASAISFLHSNGVVYRDLKPENLVLDSDGHVVLTDFGLAKRASPRGGAGGGGGGGGGASSPAKKKDDGGLYTFCGTPEYLAPEVLNGLGATAAVDWWSWGVVLFQMLTGELPFSSAQYGRLYDQILTKPPNLQHGALTAASRSVLARTLTRDRGDRLQSLAKLVKEPFFAGFDWVRLHSRDLVPPPFSTEGDAFDIMSDPASPVTLSACGVGGGGGGGGGGSGFSAAADENDEKLEGACGDHHDPFGDFTWHEQPVPL